STQRSTEAGAIMNRQQIHRAQRLIAIFVLGICDAIRTGSVSIDEAENLLFSPHTMRCLARIGGSAKIIDIIHLGTELDDVRRIVSEQELMVCLEKLISEASAFLSESEACDPQLEKWIEPIICDSIK